MYPYKIKRIHHLTDVQNVKRLERSKILLNVLKKSTKVAEIVFSDEKLFTVEAKFNSQNDRVYLKKQGNISNNLTTVFRRQKPLSVMVWAAVSKSWKSPIIFIERGVKINTDAYINKILVPASKKWQIPLETDHLSFNKMVLQPILRKNLKICAKSTFQDF